MICPPCEITDQFSVGTQNCFSTLFYTPYHSSFLACNSRLRSLILTLKQPPKMHHCQTKKNQKKILGRGHSPLLRPFPHWGGGYPLPRPHPPRRLDYRTFGAQRSRSFSFTTRTLHVGDTDKTRLYVTRSYYVLLIIVCTVMFVVRLYKRDSCVIVIIVNLKKVKVNVNLFI